MMSPSAMSAAIRAKKKKDLEDAVAPVVPATDECVVESDAAPEGDAASVDGADTDDAKKKKSERIRALMKKMGK